MKYLRTFLFALILTPASSFAQFDKASTEELFASFDIDKLGSNGAIIFYLENGEKGGHLKANTAKISFKDAYVSFIDGNLDEPYVMSIAYPSISCIKYLSNPSKNVIEIRLR